MKFTNGYWMIRDGVDALYAREAYELAADATTESLNVLAPTPDSICKRNACVRAGCLRL